MVERVLFDLKTAEDKLGQQVETLVGLSGVPEGTRGKVIRADECGDGYHLAVEWALEGWATPLVDWFTRNEYEERLKEV